MTAIRVAVVDDHGLFREGVRALLAAQTDIDLVGEGADARAALRIAVSERPDVLLLDVHMPGMSGLAALAGIRRSAPDVAIVMLTMVDEDAAVAEALAAGAVGYVLKGADPDELLRTVAAAARGDLLLGTAAADAARRLLQVKPGPWAPPLPQLTDRERAVADLLAAGRSAADIASALHLSVKTVRNILAVLPRRVGVATRDDVVRVAREAGLGR